MPDEPVLTERRDGVLLITLNRPDARNAVNPPSPQGIAAALDDLDADDELRAGVLTGAGKGVLLRHGPQGVRHRRAAVVEGRGFAGHRRSVRRASR